MNSKLTKVLRILLGVLLLVHGLNKFLDYLPHLEMPEAAENLMNALINTGYLIKIVGVTEVLAGLLLLLNKWVPFALILFAPIGFNIVLFHIFLAPDGILISSVIFLIECLLIYNNLDRYKTLF